MAAQDKNQPKASIWQPGDATQQSTTFLQKDTFCDF